MYSRGDPGVPSTVAPTRYNNFAPRLGLAYTPASSGGFLEKILGQKGESSIRAGFGLFFTAFQGGTNFLEIGDAPFGYFYASPAPPLFATPFVDRETGNVEGQRFPVSFPANGFSAAHPDTSVDWSDYLPISSSPGFFPGNRSTYAEDYSLSFQRQLGARTVLSLNYLGAEGHRLLGALESNPGDQSACLNLVSQTADVALGTTPCGPFGETTVYTTAGGQTVNGNATHVRYSLRSERLF